MIEPLMDWAREARTGLAEAVFAAGKSPEDLAAIAAEARANGRTLLFTRLSADRAAALAPIDYDAVSRTGILGPLPPRRLTEVAIVMGGLADRPAAQEAARTLQVGGAGARLFADVGVAGLWRLMERVDAIAAHRVVIAVAGMEGALFTVLTGLIAAPVIALPVSGGPNGSGGGAPALGSALASCAPGLVTVDIDNGFGAAQAALRLLRACAAPTMSQPLPGSLPPNGGDEGEAG